MQIYKDCIEHLVPGGHVVIGIKDMSKNKQPFLLHKMFCERLDQLSQVESAQRLNQSLYPQTLQINT